MCIAGGVDEDFKVGVVIDDRIAQRQVGPYVGLLHHGGDIKVVVVPKHLCPGGITGRGESLTADVHEEFGLGSVLPRLLVHDAVDGNLVHGTVCHIAVGLGEETGIFFGDALGIGGCHRRKRKGGRKESEIIHGIHSRGVLIQEVCLCLVHLQPPVVLPTKRKKISCWSVPCPRHDRACKDRRGGRR